MRSVAAMLSLVVLCAGCPRRHDPPDWKPSFHEPVLAPPSQPSPAVAAGWPPPPPPPPLSSSITRPLPAPVLPPLAEAVPRDGGAPFAEVRRPPDGGTVNGNPKGPRAEELEAVARGAAPALERCVDAGPLPTGVDVPVRVSYRILNIGRVGRMDIEGNLPVDVRACIQAVFDGLRFPAFEGEPVSAALPFRFRRDVVPSPAPPR